MLRERLGPDARIRGIPFGERFTLADATLSFHPAGHVLGSAMVRVEHRGQVWVVSGDYKTDPDCTGDVADPPKCHTFITESTFGLPIYRWRPRADIAHDINSWWTANAQAAITTIIYAYSLGKAQSVLALLDPSIGPILLHGAVERFMPHYRAAGVALPATHHADAASVRAANGRALIVAPPSAAGGLWGRNFGDIAEAMASGWMTIRGRRRRRVLDRGFPLSDHADWTGLQAVVAATGASRVLVTHGYSGPFSRWLREKGLDAQAIESGFVGEEDEDAPAADPTNSADPLPPPNDDAHPDTDEP